jgi:hypothetical protein
LSWKLYTIFFVKEKVQRYMQHAHLPSAEGFSFVSKKDVRHGYRGGEDHVFYAKYTP